MFPVFGHLASSVETTDQSVTRARDRGRRSTSDFDGDAVASTMVDSGDPCVPIPAEIQWLTGITNEMVRAAPSFVEISQLVFDRLEGAIFVAHNARFDYGFLRAEFHRAGLSFNARTLCTVRLSRHLYPDRSPHTLDAIIARFDSTEQPSRDRRARVLAVAARLAHRNSPRDRSQCRAVAAGRVAATCRRMRSKLCRTKRRVCSFTG